MWLCGVSLGTHIYGVIYTNCSLGNPHLWGVYIIICRCALLHWEHHVSSNYQVPYFRVFRLCFHVSPLVLVLGECLVGGRRVHPTPWRNGVHDCESLLLYAQLEVFVDQNFTLWNNVDSCTYAIWRIRCTLTTYWLHVTVFNWRNLTLCQKTICCTFITYIGVANHIVVVQCPSQQNRTIRATWWARSKTPSYW